MTIRSAIMSLVMLMVTGCTMHPPVSSAVENESVTVEISGPPGASFHAFYIADGNRSDISGRVPMTLQVHDISILVFAKDNNGDELRATARTATSNMVLTLVKDNPQAGLLQLGNGFGGSYVPASAVAKTTHNALLVIRPYWFEGTWVFDDADNGLKREPFIKGVPEMIDTVVKDIPNARAGFRLTCSEKPFPGSQHQLTWVRSESGGNFYRLDKTAMEGWLCPAMFRYFDHTPKTLYVRADPVN